MEPQMTWRVLDDRSLIDVPMRPSGKVIVPGSGSQERTVPPVAYHFKDEIPDSPMEPDEVYVVYSPPLRIPSEDVEKNLSSVFNHVWLIRTGGDDRRAPATGCRSPEADVRRPSFTMPPPNIPLHPYHGGSARGGPMMAAGPSLCIKTPTYNGQITVVDRKAIWGDEHRAQRTRPQDDGQWTSAPTAPPAMRNDRPRGGQYYKPVCVSRPPLQIERRGGEIGVGQDRGVVNGDSFRGKMTQQTTRAGPICTATGGPGNSSRPGPQMQMVQPWSQDQNFGHNPQIINNIGSMSVVARGGGSSGGYRIVNNHCDGSRQGPYSRNAFIQ